MKENWKRNKYVVSKQSWREKEEKEKYMQRMLGNANSEKRVQIGEVIMLIATCVAQCVSQH